MALYAKGAVPALTSTANAPYRKEKKTEEGREGEGKGGRRDRHLMSK